jgi:hypothetical protein
MRDKLQIATAEKGVLFAMRNVSKCAADLSPPDLPAVGLSGTNLSSVSTNQQFQMFLMYQPSSTNSIWVTLQQVHWNWAATIAFANGAWGCRLVRHFQRIPWE